MNCGGKRVGYGGDRSWWNDKRDNGAKRVDVNRQRNVCRISDKYRTVNAKYVRQ